MCPTNRPYVEFMSTVAHMENRGLQLVVSFRCLDEETEEALDEANKRAQLSTSAPTVLPVLRGSKALNIVSTCKMGSLRVPNPVI